MAITVTWGQTSTEIVTQVLNPLIVKADSDDTAEPKFKYQIRLLFGATEFYRGLFAPNNAGVAQIDIGDIVLSYLKADESPSFTQGGATVLNFPTDGNPIKYLTVTVFEVYAASETAVPTTHASGTINRTLLWSRNPHIEPTGILIKNLVPRSETLGKFLTNRPRTLLNSQDDVLGLSFLRGNEAYSGSAVELDRIRIRMYTGAALTATETITLSGSPVSPTSQANANNFLQTIQVGLNNIVLSDYDDIKPTIFPNATHWVIDLLDLAVVASESFTIVKTCKTGKQIKFINQFGVWDYFTFRGSFKESNAISRETFTRLKGNYQASTYNYQTNERGLSIYKSSESPSITLNSGYIDEATNDWLEELFQSPDVRLLENGIDIPLVLETTDYQKKTARFDGLIEVSATFKFANPKPLQR
jgi:hypothetical protein